MQVVPRRWDGRWVVAQAGRTDVEQAAGQADPRQIGWTSAGSRCRHESEIVRPARSPLFRTSRPLLGRTSRSGRAARRRRPAPSREAIGAAGQGLDPKLDVVEDRRRVVAVDQLDDPTADQDDRPDRRGDRPGVGQQPLEVPAAVGPSRSRKVGWTTTTRRGSSRPGARGAEVAGDMQPGEPDRREPPASIVWRSVTFFRSTSPTQGRSWTRKTSRFEPGK